MNTYFNLRAPDRESLRADNMKGAPDERREILRCPINSEHLDGSRRLSGLALDLKHSDRDELIIWPWVEGCVIHQQVLEKFRQRGFTGYRLNQATVRFRDGVISKDYRELVVTGWAGVARPESGVRIVKECPRCHWKKYSGLRNVEQLIDWSQWTGEDFFMVWPLPNFILVTERVAELLLDLRVKSFELKGLQDLDPMVREFGFTVGRLSDFLPEDLAVKYGRPLGLE